MATCRALFEECGLEGAELQAHIDRSRPDFICENETCSGHSPGAVADDEEIAFILVHPNHYDAVREKVVPAAFDELIKRDLSVLRTLYGTKQEAETIRSALAARAQPGKPREFNEACVAPVSEVRAREIDGARAMAVYDTALPHIPAHASIFTTETVLNNRPLRLKVRSLIHEVLANRRVSFDDLLAKLA
jgi:hypothetical protein